MAASIAVETMGRLGGASCGESRLAYLGLWRASAWELPGYMQAAGDVLGRGEEVEDHALRLLFMLRIRRAPAHAPSRREPQNQNTVNDSLSPSLLFSPSTSQPSQRRCPKAAVPSRSPSWTWGRPPSANGWRRTPTRSMPWTKTKTRLCGPW